MLLLWCLLCCDEITVVLEMTVFWNSVISKVTPDVRLGDDRIPENCHLQPCSWQIKSAWLADHCVHPSPTARLWSGRCLVRLRRGWRSIQRTYRLFRTLGLRFLCVVNHHNQFVGIITRKDLLPESLSDSLMRGRNAHMDTTYGFD